MTYKLATNLTLSAAAVTETAAFFGTRGTGKTYGCGKQIEEFHDGGAQVVVVDPVGVWYGLRIAANGRGRGLDIPVFGGLHGDVPLEPTGGELVARLVVEKRISVVLDVSMFTLAQQHRFVTAFATALFNLKKADRSPLHIVFDEAHEFLPQFVQGSEAEMVGAVRRLSKMGRNFGIGVSLISPRPAEVNKGSVNLTERMYCGRLKGPQDRKAIEAWASTNDADQSVLDELPQLKNGDLIAWTDKGPQRVRFLPKRTFDASKTPEARDAKPSASLPKIDLDQVREAMAATIEEAKANDPKALRARVVELERQLQAKVPAAVAPTKTVTVKVPAISEKELARVEALAEKVIAHQEKLRETWVVVGDLRTRDLEKLGAQLADLTSAAKMAAAPGPTHPHPAIARDQRALAPVRPAPFPVSGERPRAPITGAATEMPEGVRKALTVMAQFPEGVTRRKLGILAGYAPDGSSMRGILAHLRKLEESWHDEDGDLFRLSDAGAAALGTYDALPSGAALQAHWLRELEKCPADILRCLIDAWPNPLSKQDIQSCSEGNYSAGGSSMRGGLARLRALDLVDDVGEDLRASEHLFDASAARGRAA